MLDVISEGFREAKLRFKGQATLTEDTIKDALSDIRKSLLEADVEYSVAKTFLNKVQQEAVGQIVQTKAGKGSDRVNVKPADHFVKICHQELERLMGPVDTSLKFPVNRPALIMMVGLQGSGKTTSTGKLANYLKNQKKRSPLLVAADIYRPAAVQQLRVLGDKLGLPVFHIEGATPVTICQEAVKKAYELDCDTILFDTAGRLTVDAELIQELVDIKRTTQPDNIFFVCDAMMGQDAVTTAKAFNETLDISGVIMTKLDGDARGGAALSIKEVTGKPIKFLGMGEDLARLEEFRPEGLASRILGMGDVVGLMEDFSRVAEQDQEDAALKMLQGQFTFREFYEQISMIQKMGPLKDIVAKLPMQDMIPKGVAVDDKELIKIKAMIDSMTEGERIKPGTINPSRARRIARGSGRPERDVNELIKKFNAMRQMMSMLGQGMGGMLGKIPGMGALNQLNNMRKMAKGMQGGGMPGMGGLPGMGGMNPFAALAGGGVAAPRPVDRDKQKKLRKAAKNARKKNRK